MGLLTDIRKKFSATPSTSLDGYGERRAPSTVPRGNTGAAGRSQTPRPRRLDDGGSDSQDSGVVILPKDSSITLTKNAEHACPNCAAQAAAPRNNLSRPSMERMKSFSSSRQQPLHDQPRMMDQGYDNSRPGTGYSNHSGLAPMQSHHNHDPTFSQRPLSWGRRATTEDINQGSGGSTGYNRPVTPPYSIRSEQIGWNSGQQYSDMYVHGPPGPGSVDGGGGFSERPLSWRRATSSHLNRDQDQRQPRSFGPTPSQTSRTPSETGSSHPRNVSRNMENTAYEAGYRDAIARLKADADRW